MAEQLAENYHNTWGRKKKLELQSKGLLFSGRKPYKWRDSVSALFPPTQEAERTLCWCPTTH